MDQINVPTPPYFDPAALRGEFASYWREGTETPSQIRAHVLRRLKELKQNARAEAQALLLRTGDGCACAKALATFQDELIKLIYDYSTTYLYRAQNPSAAEHMAIVATGGYGRGMLAFHVIGYRSAFSSAIQANSVGRKHRRIRSSISSGTSATRLAMPPARSIRP